MKVKNKKFISVTLINNEKFTSFFLNKENDDYFKFKYIKYVLSNIRKNIGKAIWVLIRRSVRSAALDGYRLAHS